MTLRNSLSEPYASSDAVNSGGETVSDYEAAGGSASFWSVIGSIFKAVTICMIIFGVAAFVFPYLFPQWSENYQTELKEMRIAANTGGFFKNAIKVDWKKAFMETNIEEALLVGTGRHSQFKTDKSLEGYWYLGKDVFIMKTYVNELDYKRYAENIHAMPDGEMVFPATDIDHDEAAEYCQAKNARLPAPDEIMKALHFANIKNLQGEPANFLRPNLQFDVYPEIALWTNAPQDESFFNGDNYLIIKVGSKNYYYQDNSYNDEYLGFVCVKDAVK